jgi:hypothetical protein
MSATPIRGFDRPVSLGGLADAGDDTLTVRWFGTTNFEVQYRDTTVLLDNFYDRGPRTSAIGFAADEVVRADYILIGHPHYDHIADTAFVAGATNARVLVHSIGADLLVQQGMSASRIEAVNGLGSGELYDFGEMRIRVIHGVHMRREGPVVTTIKDLRPEWDDDLGPLTSEEDERLKRLYARGSLAPEVFTDGTLCFVIEIGEI